MADLDPVSTDVDEDIGKADQPTTKADGKEMTWDDLVAKYGQDKAAKLAPQIDPRYQQLVASEGQAKGSAEYAAKYMDPGTVTAQGWAGLGSPAEIKEGIPEEEEGTGLEGLPGKIEGGIGSALMGAPGALGSFGPKTDPAKAKSTTTTNTTTTPTTTPVDYADQLMDGLVNQFASAESGITPYLNNKVASNDTSYAAGLGQAVGGVAYGQDPAYAAALAGPAQQVAQANAAGAGAITGALQGTGEALNLYMQTAPYQGLLSALQSEAQYKTETGTPTFSIAGTPKWVQQAYQATIGNSAPETTTPSAAAPTTSSSTPSTDTPDTAGGQ